MLRFIRGWFRLSVTGRNPERFFNLCRNRGLVMWDIIESNGHYKCCMYMDTSDEISTLAEKADVVVTCLEKHGLPAYWERYKNRQAFFIACLFVFCLLGISSSYIWNIKVENNLYYSEDQILSCLEENGIMAGVRKKRINCDAVESLLRDTFERISWSAVTVNGTVLEITVAENYGELEVSMEEKEPADLIAETDGIVTSLVVRQGTAQVQIGDTVAKGQVLVSGCIPYHNDSAEIMGYKFVCADADVMIQTSVSYQDTISPEKEVKQYCKNKGSTYHFMIMGKTWKFETPWRKFWKWKECSSLLEKLETFKDEVKDKVINSVKDMISGITGGWNSHETQGSDFEKDYENVSGSKVSEIEENDSGENDFAQIDQNEKDLEGNLSNTDVIGSGFYSFQIPEWNISIYGYQETAQEYEVVHVWLSESQITALLQQKMSLFLEKLEENGDVVVENQVRIYYDSVVYRAQGEILILRPQTEYRKLDISQYQIETEAEEETDAGH